MALLPKAELLECLFDAEPNGIIIKDLDGRYRYLNRQAQNLLNLSQHDLECDDDDTGLSNNKNNNRKVKIFSDFDFYEPETARTLQEARIKCIQTGEKVVTRWVNDKNNSDAVTAGETFHVPLKDKLGNTVAVYSSVPPAKSLSSSSRLRILTSSSHQHLLLHKNDGDDSIEESSLDDDDDDDDNEETKSEKENQIAALNTIDISEYRDVFQNIQASVMMGETIVDSKTGEPVDWIYLEMNHSFETLFQKPRHELVNQRVSHVFPSILRDKVNWIQRFGNVALTGVCDVFLQYSTPRKKWFSGVAYRPDPGQKRRFVVVFMDHSEQMLAQEALRESEERHRNLFESMMQGVVYQEQGGAIVACNPAAERILGLSVDQMMGRTSIDPRWKSIREDGSDFLGNEHPSMESLATGKSVTDVTMGVFSPDYGEYRWIKVDAVPQFKPGDQKPYQVYTTFTDITDAKRFEQEILRAKNRAEEADKLKSAFLANMSHEIRTPLNGILGHIDLALANDLNPVYHEDNLEGLKIARKSGELLLSIIQDILDLSKIEAGQLTIRLDEVFSLNQVVDQTVNIARALSKSRKKMNLAFEVHVDPRIAPNLHGDSFRIQQVINNLVSNAIKFTEDEGKVVLTVKLLGSGDNGNGSAPYLEYSVLDTGKGIPETHIESVFKPFSQVDYSDTRQHGGTGLGLTISRKLVELMQGKLRVESSILGPIRGSFFAFTLPYWPSAATAEEHISEDGRQHQQNIQPGSVCLHDDETNSITVCSAASLMCEDPTILVAEDDPISRRLVQRMLQRNHVTQGQYKVLLAKDGIEAIELYENNRQNIVLILMDVQMPRMDGHSATQRIRQLEQEHQGAENSRGVPIVALSAGAMKGDLEQGLAFGMTDYLTKPVDFQLLVNTLQCYLKGDNSAIVTSSMTSPCSNDPAAAASSASSLLGTLSVCKNQPFW